MKKYLDSIYLVYFTFFVMLILMLFVKNIQFEPVEIGRITQILHPEYPKGELHYDPMFNYNYIVAFAAKLFGYGNNFLNLAKVFWFLETGLSVWILIIISNYVFKNDRIILAISVIMFLLLNSGETDQKTMARPLYFIAMYFFLKEKWLFSALFGGVLFYLHIGLSIWWFLSSCFALTIIYLVYKTISLKQIIKYTLVIIIFAAPIIYFYFGKASVSELDKFSIEYYYYACGRETSVLLTLGNGFVGWMSPLMVFALFFVGYRKAKESGYTNGNIVSIVIGVLIIYVVDFIFADVLHNTAVISLQLLRSILHVEFFSNLFLSFILAKHIKKGNYIFCSLFLLLFLPYGILESYFFVRKDIALIVFYCSLVTYEIFERHINSYLEEIFKALNGKFDLTLVKEYIRKGHWLLQKPIIIVIFVIFLIFPKLPLLKSSIQTVLGIPQNKNSTSWNKHENMYNDVTRFVNEKIHGKDVLLIIPFAENDFCYYVKHRIFMTYDLLLDLTNNINFSRNFKDILENDLHSSIKQLFEDGANNLRKKWEVLWKDLDEDIILRWKERHGVTHVIRENEFPLNFPIIYQNQFYTVYNIS